MELWEDTRDEFKACGALEELVAKCLAMHPQARVQRSSLLSKSGE